MNTPAETRFAMVKERHANSLKTAIAEKKIDPLMIPISRAIAKTHYFFTSSTCSGRITLMDLNTNEAKKPGAFFRKWHRVVILREVWDGIQDHTNTGNLWFKQDAFVFLIGTNTMENAQHILRICHENGVKRAGINHAEPGKVHVEIFGTQNMSVPVKEGKKILVEKEYVKRLVSIANRKWKQNDALLKTFCKALAKELE